MTRLMGGLVPWRGRVELNTDGQPKAKTELKIGLRNAWEDSHLYIHHSAG